MPLAKLTLIWPVRYSSIDIALEGQRLTPKDVNHSLGMAVLCDADWCLDKMLAYPSINSEGMADALHWVTNDKTEELTPVCASILKRLLADSHITDDLRDTAMEDN